MVVFNTLDVERNIVARFKETGNYAKMYQEYAVLADCVWASTSRNDYEADLWYNHNRNEIGLEMLGDICCDKKVLAVGARHWIEGEFLESLKIKELVRTDIVPDEANNISEANIENLPFQDASFDMVICREAIEHVMNEEIAYAEMKRVLRPSGYLFITTPNVFAMQPDGTIHRRGYTPVSFIRELEGHGYIIIKKRGNVPYIFNSLLPLCLSGFPEALKEFKEWDRVTKGFEERYYLSTQLFVLCQRGDK